MKFDIKYLTPDEATSYPYWARNSQGDLFLVTSKGRGIAVSCWNSIRDINEVMLIPLPAGTVITITIGG